MCKKQNINDNYETFRYFYECLNKARNKRLEEINLLWKKVNGIFSILQGWYNDFILYHYIGYLIALNSFTEKNIELKDLLCRFENCDKDKFLVYLKREINNRIEYKDLNKTYDLKGCPSKRKCIPLLFLYNIQTSINEKEKFEFHRFKVQEMDSNKRCQVEHIDPATPKDWKTKDVEDWLECQKKACVDDKDLLKMIDDFIDHRTRQGFKKIIKKLESNSRRLNEKQKNQIMNFALLDKKTNINNSNNLFFIKCDIVNKASEGDSENAPRFVPICTKKVFKDLDSNKNKLYWDEDDAEKYRDNIFNTLKQGGFKVLK